MMNLKCILIFVLFICDRNEAFNIQTCGSNMITEVTPPDPKTKKAVIRFDESKKIDNSFTGDINLYCESDYNYDKCTLTFQKKGGADTKKCEVSVPPKCTAENICEDNNIIRNQVSSNKCSFTLTRPLSGIKEDGKYTV